jgi:hypothetical protein
MFGRQTIAVASKRTCKKEITVTIGLIIMIGPGGVIFGCTLTLLCSFFSCLWMGIGNDECGVNMKV